jgi:hypothetical protein
MTNAITIAIQATTAKAIGEIDKIQGKLTGLTTSEGFKGAVKGVGMGVGIQAFNLLTGAIDMAVGKLGEAGQAYRDDQASQALLATALKANIPNWDGNTAGSEAFAASLGRLGFTDETVRAALEQTIGVTHDLTAAQGLVSLAADLAAAKNISLATATDYVTRANEGNSRGLVSLGIDIGNAKTAAELLDVTQQNVKGSAEALAATNEGRLAASNVKVQEAMEKVGKVVDALTTAILPLLADAFVAVTNFMDQNLGPAFKVIGDNMGIVKIVGAALAVVVGVSLVTAAASAVAGMATLTIATGAAIAPWIALGAAIAAVVTLADRFSKTKPPLNEWYDFLHTGTPPSLFGGGGPLGSNPGGLKGYASGGIVPGPVGVPTLAIVHGGESITPAGRGGLTLAAGAIVVNGNSDPDATARAVLQALKREMGRQGISLA